MATGSTFPFMLVLPLLAGAVVAAVNSEGLNDAAETAEGWAREKEGRIKAHGGKFSSFVARPLLLAIVKFCDWTDSFEQRGVKNGTRVAVALYLGLLWLYLLYAMVAILVGLVVVGVIVYVGFKLLINSDPDVRRGYEASRRVVGTAPPGRRVHPDTGVIQEEGLLGWRDTDQRVNPETGRVQKSGLIGWEDTDVRIDQESGSIQKEELLGFRDTKTRINPDTGIIQKEELLGWQDTDERIDPASGKRQRRGLIGWEDE